MDIGKYAFNAKQYARYRQEYPQDFIDYLYGDTGLSPESVVADIGSGTGLLSRPLLRRGSQVYGVEPNEEMRQTAEKELSAFAGFYSVNGTAEHTTLQDYSVDIITAGTAFHWFDRELFQKECRRILKPGGQVVLVWISRPVNRGGHFEINIDGQSGGIEEKPELIAPFFRDSRCDYRVFREEAVYDKAAFIGRALSTFRNLTDAVYMEELSDLFDRQEVNQAVTIPLYTRSYAGEV